MNAYRLAGTVARHLDEATGLKIACQQVYLSKQELKQRVVTPEEAQSVLRSVLATVLDERDLSDFLLPKSPFSAVEIARLMLDVLSRIMHRAKLTKRDWRSRRRKWKLRALLAGYIAGLAGIPESRAKNLALAAALWSECLVKEFQRRKHEKLTDEILKRWGLLMLSPTNVEVLSSFLSVLDVDKCQLHLVDIIRVATAGKYQPSEVEFALLIQQMVKRVDDKAAN